MSITDGLFIAGSVLGGAALVLLPLELVWLRRRGRMDRARWRAMAGSASVVVPAIAAGGITLAFFLAVLAGAARLSPWAIPTNPWTAILAVLAVDFAYYWDHRAGHAWWPYWALSHSVHHSGSTYDQSIGLRVSVTDGLFAPFFYAPLALIGFDPLVVLAAFTVVVGYQQWIHTEAVGSLPWLDGWLNTPANHRVHHAVQPRYHDKNFGGIFMLWDRWFGTYARESVPPRYGITHALASDHPWQIHTHEAARWVRTWAGASWVARFRLLFGRPR